ncbi:YacL family protein [Marinobacterium arenosum]|uniref:YacL family protein n=1 Tax=Marinobacterium arenosum TaxID=2862496 RepID=UPI001C960692|nr:YacL family protein [Marinobacterium arenosum]MBY4676954.1 YacL family protein [Marinobacterium arenosum]
MEYEFGRDIIDRPYARFSMGHEAFGHWLVDELGEDQARLAGVQQQVARLLAGQGWEYELAGREFSLQLSRDEVVVRSNALGYEVELPPEEDEEELSCYDDELQAGCGLQDFAELLVAWRTFLQGDRG